MEPLKVTFTLRSPMIHHNSRQGIHLDSLLAYALVDEADEAGEDDPWGASGSLDGILGRATAPDGTSVWMASQLVCTPSSDIIFINQTRKCDPEGFLAAKDRGVLAMRGEAVATDKGQQKAYQFLVGYQWMSKVEAWCYGDAEVIAELLDRLPGIGKMVRNGYGLIQSVAVEPSREATVKWRLRTLPVGMDGAPGVNYVPAVQCLTPPYWRKANEVLAQDPVL